MTPLLRSVCIPIISDRLVEWLQCLEFNAVLFLIIFTYIHQIVGKLLVILWPQVIFTSISISANTAAIGHVKGTGIAESLENSIGTLLLNLEHNFTLGSISIPVIFIATEILKAFHLCTKAFTLAHVMLVAMTVLRIVSPTYIITEMAIVEACRTGKPSHYLVNLLVRPLAALTGPPTE